MFFFAIRFWCCPVPARAAAFACAICIRFVSVRLTLFAFVSVIFGWVRFTLFGFVSVRFESHCLHSLFAFVSFRFCSFHIIYIPFVSLRFTLFAVVCFGPFHIVCSRFFSFRFGLFHIVWFRFSVLVRFVRVVGIRCSKGCAAPTCKDCKGTHL